MHRLRTGLAPLIVLFAAACSDDSPAPELTQPSTIVAVSGDGQRVVNGPAPAADSLVVRVLNPMGQGVAGVSVSWSASDATGGVSPSSVSTDAQGRAATRWTLGSSAGTQTARATTSAISGAAVVFTGVNRMPSGLEIAAGDGQSLVNGPDALPDSLVVRVVDAQGAAIPGAQVTWSVGEGAGSVDPATATADAQGLARTAWTLGDTEGMQTVTAALASVEGVSTTFLAEHVLLTIEVAVTTDPMPPLGLAPEAPARTQGRRSPSLANAEPDFPPIQTGRLIVRHEPQAVGLNAAGPVLGLQEVASASTRLRATTAQWQRAGAITAAEISPVLLTTRVQVAEGVDLESYAAQLRQQPGIAEVMIEQLEYRRPHVERRSMVPSSKLQWPRGPGPSSVVRSQNPPSRIDSGERYPEDLFFWALQSWHYNAVDAPRAWSVTTGDPSVMVAVVDDGIRFDHPDIAANLSSDGYNFVAAGTLLDREYDICTGGVTQAEEAGYGPDPTQPMVWEYSYFSDCLYPSFSGNHGLHVAGTIGAAGDLAAGGYGALGLNWQVTIRPVRVLNTLGYGSLFDVAQGVLYAAGLPASDGAGGTVTAPTAAPIINMSLGGGGSALEAEAVAAASAAGSLVIASAGNASSSFPSFPAANPEALSVVALGPDLQLASYSNIGTSVDLAAPGGDFRFDGLVGVVSTTWDFASGLPNVDFWQGTSMAAPHVSGVAALVLAANPGMTSEQLRERLLSTAVPLGPQGWDARWGHGLVSAYNAVTGRADGPVRETQVRLYDPQTGDLVMQQTADAAGNASFRGIDEGAYWVVAGEVPQGSARLDQPRQRLGWFGSPGLPEAVHVAVEGPRRVVRGVRVGTPFDVGSNVASASAQPLPIGTYLVGDVAPDELYAYYEVRIPLDGVWRFETDGVLGECGSGLEIDTVIALFDDAGTEIGSNDDRPSDVPGSLSMLCSFLELELSAGVYHLQVRSYDEFFWGRFSVRAFQAGS